MPVAAFVVENAEHLVSGQGAVALGVTGNPVHQPRHVAHHVAVLHLVIKYRRGQVEQVIACARCPRFAALDLTAPQPTDQTVEVGFREFLNLDVAQLIT